MSLPVLPAPVVMSRPVEEVSSFQYIAGAAAKRRGLPANPVRGTTMQSRERWLAGWHAARVVRIECQGGFEQAVTCMSDEQLLEEYVELRRRWFVALRAGTDDRAWQMAIIRERGRRIAAAKDAVAFA
jgi:ribosome modulation factor